MTRTCWRCRDGSTDGDAAACRVCGDMITVQEPGDTVWVLAEGGCPRAYVVQPHGSLTEVDPSDAIGRVRRRAHHYLSTACLHADEPGREQERLHEYCQSNVSGMGAPKQPSTCKFCGAECVCRCHQGADMPPSTGSQ